MQDGKKYAVIYTVIIAIVLFAVNMIYGNPFSLKRAQSCAEKYITENHPGYETKRLWYDWVNGQYCAEVWIPGSQDCIFMLDINHFGKVRYSDYKYNVANNFNTFNRANMIYSRMCDPVIDKFTNESKVPQGQANHGSFGLGDIHDISKERMMQPPFENDKVYTREEINALAAEYGAVYIYFKDTPRNMLTAENLAKIILQVKNEFDADDVKFNKLTIYLQGTESEIYWNNIPYDIIDRQNIHHLTKENSIYEEY